MCLCKTVHDKPKAISPAYSSAKASFRHQIVLRHRHKCHLDSGDLFYFGFTVIHHNLRTNIKKNTNKNLVSKPILLAILVACDPTSSSLRT